MAFIYHESNQSNSMTESEMVNNAWEIKRLLENEGWALNPICAVCGNFQWESYLNPAQWQIGHPIGGNTGGLGLGMWTPPSHWRDYANDFGKTLYSGDAQIAYFLSDNIYYSGSFHGEQWNSGPSPGWSWSYFQTATDSVDDCTRAFFNQWEQPGDDTLTFRQEMARDWYEVFQGEPPGPEGEIPIWLLEKMARNNAMNMARKIIINRRLL